MKAVYINDSNKGPGYGYLQITDALLTNGLEGLRFSIRRASDKNCLGKSGWQPAEVFLTPLAIMQSNALFLSVGPEVTDNLDARETYRLVLLSQDNISVISSLDVPEVAYSVLRDRTGAGAGPTTEKTPPPPAAPAPPLPEPPPAAPAPPLPEPPPAAPAPPIPPLSEVPAPSRSDPNAFLEEPFPEPDDIVSFPSAAIPLPRPQRQSPVVRPLLLVLLLALLAGGGFGVWHYLRGKNAPPPAARTETPSSAQDADTAQPSSPSATAQPSFPSATRANNQPQFPPVETPPHTQPSLPSEPAAQALAKARAHLIGPADPVRSLNMAKELHTAEGGADAAFLLAEDAAQKGNAEAMALTAGFYDPLDTSPSGTIIKDPEQALLWYQNAITAGRDEAMPRLQTLRDWVAAEADKGSAEARALLRRF